MCNWTNLQPWAASACRAASRGRPAASGTSLWSGRLTAWATAGLSWRSPSSTLPPASSGARSSSSTSSSSACRAWPSAPGSPSASTQTATASRPRTRSYSKRCAQHAHCETSKRKASSPCPRSNWHTKLACTSPSLVINRCDLALTLKGDVEHFISCMAIHLREAARGRADLRQV